MPAPWKLTAAAEPSGVPVRQPSEAEPAMPIGYVVLHLVVSLLLFGAVLCLAGKRLLQLLLVGVVLACTVLGYVVERRSELAWGG